MSGETNGENLTAGAVSSRPAVSPRDAPGQGRSGRTGWAEMIIWSGS
jgi:hypothetical protein